MPFWSSDSRSTQRYVLAVFKETFDELNKDNRIWWGIYGKNVPRLKRFLSEVKDGVVPETIWVHQQVGNTEEAKKELLSVCDFVDSQSVFITPKPTRLLKRILEIASDKNSIIMDSFAGSGTTGHAVMQINKLDGGNRRFILVEMEASISRDVTAKRVQKVAIGYRNTKGEVIEGLGGGFRYCVLGEPCFDETGKINSHITYDELARHVWLRKLANPWKTRAKTNVRLSAFTVAGLFIFFTTVSLRIRNRMAVM